MASFQLAPSRGRGQLGVAAAAAAVAAAAIAADTAAGEVAADLRGVAAAAGEVVVAGGHGRAVVSAAAALAPAAAFRGIVVLRHAGRVSFSHVSLGARGGCAVRSGRRARSAVDDGRSTMALAKWQMAVAVVAIVLHILKQLKLSTGRSSSFASHYPPYSRTPRTLISL